jgi:YD repeat-containing protein
MPRVIRQYDNLGRKTSFSYYVDGFTTQTTLTDPKGNQTVYEYLGNQLISETHGFGSTLAATWKYKRDPVSFASMEVQDPNGHWTAVTRDSNGNVLSSTDGLGRTSTYTYNAFSEPLTANDPLHVTTTNTYDIRGNLTQVDRPLVGSAQTMTVKYAFTDAGHPGDMTQLTDANNKVWTSAYNTNGDRVAQTDPLGNKTSYGYDGVGRMTTMVTPNGNVTGGNPAAYTWNYAANNFGRPTSVAAPTKLTSRPIPTMPIRT